VNQPVQADSESVNSAHFVHRKAITHGCGMYPKGAAPSQPHSASDQVNRAALEMFLCGIRQWPAPSVPKRLAQFTSATLDAAWAQIQGAKKRARDIANSVRNTKSIGDRIEESGVPVLFIADACGVSVETVRCWVRGSVKPSPREYAAVVKVLEDAGKPEPSEQSESRK
jgi:hypothetical protein